MPVYLRHAFICGTLLLGCASHTSKTATTSVVTTPVAAPAPSAPEPAQPEPPGALARTDTGDYIGVIDRDGLSAIIQQGLGHMLARLQLSPELDGKRFRGFRVAALDPQWSGSGVLAGDVITRLNGQSIERPEQALAAFDSLRVASEVAVDVMRDGKPMRLRYRVE